MNILVYDVAASEGGALSILQEYYSKCSKDQSNHYYFVISTPMLENTNNITVLRFPDIKKSWLHRIFFDIFKIRKIIKSYNIEQIISLQNIIVWHMTVPQILYLHQPLPFVQYQFSLFENRTFWIYQHIIGKLIKHSVCHATKVIVQTQWMKQVCIEQCHVVSKQIDVIAPSIDSSKLKYFVEFNLKRKTFFYPAGVQSYKNHMIILEACKMLQMKGVDNSFYEVLFTIEGNENSYTKKIYQYAVRNKLPIRFLGPIKREKVFDLYSKSILLFPSYIETFGLPLLEAKLSRCLIVASDTVFSKEILSNYGNVFFCDPFDKISWFQRIYQLIKQVTY
ncbi:glycosyltransferase [Megasphaera sueciensis]|uniref:glycosyltransferase n=1 Tax=Megasphaera sueciensis TaxID=349094 RepID=UPI003D04DE35